MRTRQDAGADGDRADGTRITPIDARFACKDTAAHDARLDVEEQVADGSRIRRALSSRQNLDRLVGNLSDALSAELLAGDAESLLKVGFDQSVQFGDQFLVLWCWRPIPLGLAGLFNEFVDCRNHGLHLLVAVDNRAKHDFFRQDVRF